VGTGAVEYRPAQNRRRIEVIRSLLSLTSNRWLVLLRFALSDKLSSLPHFQFLIHYFDDADAFTDVLSSADPGLQETSRHTYFLKETDELVEDVEEHVMLYTLYPVLYVPNFAYHLATKYCVPMLTGLKQVILPCRIKND